MFNTRLVELVSLTLMHYPDGKVAAKVTVSSTRANSVARVDSYYQTSRVLNFHHVLSFGASRSVALQSGVVGLRFLRSDNILTSGTARFHHSL